MRRRLASRVNTISANKMDRTHTFRYARICIATLCLLVNALTLGLWVRSYYRDDAMCVGITEKSGFILESTNRQLVAAFMSFKGGNLFFSCWGLESFEVDHAYWIPFEAVKDKGTLGFDFRVYSRSYSVFIGRRKGVRTAL